MAKKRRKQATKRIYYGPPGREKSIWWDITLTDARRNVVINGSVVHALRGIEGVTIGCGLSNVAVDNADAFPHAVHLGVFTKRTAIIINRLKRNGEPRSGVLYHHDYSHITDANDDGTLKKMVKEDPSIMEREFILRVPRTSNRPSGKTAGKTPRERRGTTGHGETFIPRGALARAVRAGRVGAHVARQLTDVAKKSDVA